MLVVYTWSRTSQEVRCLVSFPMRDKWITSESTVGSTNHATKVWGWRFTSFMFSFHQEWITSVQLLPQTLKIHTKMHRCLAQSHINSLEQVAACYVTYMDIYHLNVKATVKRNCIYIQRNCISKYALKVILSELFSLNRRKKVIKNILHQKIWSCSTVSARVWWGNVCSFVIYVI